MTCPECGSDMCREIECPDCRGTGLHEWDEGEDCPNCDGFGDVEDEYECWDCGCEFVEGD